MPETAYPRMWRAGVGRNVSETVLFSPPGEEGSPSSLAACGAEHPPVFLCASVVKAYLGVGYVAPSGLGVDGGAIDPGRWPGLRYFAPLGLKDGGGYELNNPLGRKTAWPWKCLWHAPVRLPSPWWASTRSGRRVDRKPGPLSDLAHRPTRSECFLPLDPHLRKIFEVAISGCAPADDRPASRDFSREKPNAAVWPPRSAPTGELTTLLSKTGAACGSAAPFCGRASPFRAEIVRFLSSSPRRRLSLRRGEDEVGRYHSIPGRRSQPA